MSSPIQFDEAVGFAAVQAKPFSGAPLPLVVKEAMQRAKAARLTGSPLQNLWAN